MYIYIYIDAYMARGRQSNVQCEDSPLPSQSDVQCLMRCTDPFEVHCEAFVKALNVKPSTCK